MKMSYGINFDDVRKANHPEKIGTNYGYFIDAIDEMEFSLKQIFFKKGTNAGLKLRGVLFIESGDLKIDNQNLKKGNILRVNSNIIKELKAKKDSLVYLFSGNPIYPPSKLRLRKTFDVREKYWGKIETIVNDDKINLSGKRIFMKKGRQSSLEYHVRKKEGYFLQSGKLKIGLRVGRAENKSVILNQGDSYVMYPGLMHMRIALEDSVIIEASTKDDDKDSHLVEDGKTYVHKED